MKVEVLTQEKDAAYSAYLMKHDHSLFNSSLVFRDFIRVMCPDALPYYLLAIEDDEIVGVLPTFIKKGPLGPVLNSLPWFGSNPGILADDTQAEMYLLQGFDNIAKWTGCFSSTFITPPNQDQEMYDAFFAKRDVFPDTRIGMITPLPVFTGPDQFAKDLLNLIHQKARNQIIKSMQTCCAYESYGPDDWAFLKEQHRIGMTAVDGPVKDKEFDVIRKYFKKGHDYKLYVALTNDSNANRCAALLVEYFNKTVEYICPTIVEDYRHLCPMNLLIFSAMGDAAQRGMKWWNWGGTKLPGQQGVYHFKTQFGAQESEYTYYTQVYHTPPMDLEVTPQWLVENYRYFYVMPYSLLETTGE